MSTNGDAEAVYRSHTLEVFALSIEFAKRIGRAERPEDVFAIRREENAAMIELLQQQARTLAFMAGEPVEPKVHFAEVTLVGLGGQL